MPKKLELQYFEAVGRRKEAVARVRIYAPSKTKIVSLNGLKIKAGEIFVNKKPIQEVFPSAVDRVRYLHPLKLTGGRERFAVSILVKGGGKTGQLEAIIHGLTRAIEKSDKKSYRPLLKKEGLLTRDARTKERRKVGTGGKARRQKQSPKR